jgi:hypothetical protein
LYSEPNLSYVFSDDDAEGKINFKNLLKDKNSSLMPDRFFECLVNPVK